MITFKTATTNNKINKNKNNKNNNTLVVMDSNDGQSCCY